MVHVGVDPRAPAQRTDRLEHPFGVGAHDRRDVFEDPGPVWDAEHLGRHAGGSDDFGEREGRDRVPRRGEPDGRDKPARELQLRAHERDHLNLGELRSLADAWRLSHEQGLPLAPALLALTETVRERERTRLLEEGGKAAVHMLFPVALFIFPVFLVVLLYPAGVALLGLR